MSLVTPKGCICRHSQKVIEAHLERPDTVMCHTWDTMPSELVMIPLCTDQSNRTDVISEMITLNMLSDLRLSYC